MRKLTFILAVLTISFNSFAQKFYTVNQIPSPKLAGQAYFVSNPDGVLSNVETINGLLVELEQQTKVEFAVVVVNNFEEDEDDFEFAKALFDKWKIGKAGSNNGLLLLIAKDRRKYRFISGSGVEGLLPDVVLKQIGARNLVPAFREERYDEGVINAINEINYKLTNPQSRSEIQGLILQQKEKTSDWQTGLGGSAVVIILFIFVFKLVNKQGKKSTALESKDVKITDLEPSIAKPNSIKEVKKNKVIKDKNGYDAVARNGCTGTFFVVFIATFILIFSGGFGLFDNFRIVYIPVILYVVCAIGLFFRYYSYIANLRRAHFDDENFFEAVKEFHAKNWWLIIFSPLIIIALIVHATKKIRTAERFRLVFDSQNQEMIRVDRDLNLEGEPFLTKGQRAEEKVKSYDYDIWESADKKEHLVKVWPAEEYNSFTECPSCNFRTYQLNKRETVEAATYSHSGKAKLSNECSFCNHVEFIKWITLSQLIKSTSSSSSSSSGGSSSSRSGSFGGGSSSGGGAGGSW